MNFEPVFVSLSYHDSNLEQVLIDDFDDKSYFNILKYFFKINKSKNYLLICNFNIF